MRGRFLVTVGGPRQCCYRQFAIRFDAKQTKSEMVRAFGLCRKMTSFGKQVLKSRIPLIALKADCQPLQILDQYRDFPFAPR